MVDSITYQLICFSQDLSKRLASTTLFEQPANNMLTNTDNTEKNFYRNKISKINYKFPID